MSKKIYVYTVYNMGEVPLNTLRYEAHKYTNYQWRFYRRTISGKLIRVSRNIIDNLTINNHISSALLSSPPEKQTLYGPKANRVYTDKGVI